MHHCRNRIPLFVVRHFLFPGAVHPQLESLVKRHPFSSPGPVIAGYFGELNAEKGAKVILELISRYEMPEWRYIVCGSGPLHSEFAALAVQHPERLNVFSNLGITEMYRLMNEVDVLINPHSNIEAMGNGIFPFKVIEAIVSERLVVSTPLPPSKPDISSAIFMFDGSAEDLKRCLLKIWNNSHVADPSADPIVAQLREKYSLTGMRTQILRELMEVAES